MSMLQPTPQRMGVDTKAWRTTINLANVVNVFFEYRDIHRIADVGSVLLIGVTNGIEAEFLRARGFGVTTFDIDPAFEPDEVGSCDDLSRFGDGQFDFVVASHVLEHLPATRLEAALGEFARVAHHCLIYVPVGGRYLSLKLLVGTRWQFTLCFDFIRFWHRPSGIDRIYRSNEHYWEVGYLGFRRSDVRRLLSRYFLVLDEYRNTEWMPSYNFVLQSNVKK